MGYGSFIVCCGLVAFLVRPKRGQWDGRWAALITAVACIAFKAVLPLLRACFYDDRVLF
jgi:hypothetical protein